MSRTTRNYYPKLTLREADETISRPATYNRWATRWTNGYDGCSSDIGTGFSGAPRGYDTWEEVSGMKGKRFAKRHAARIVRRRGKAEAYSDGRQAAPDRLKTTPAGVAPGR
jgi:hypothetical protein